MRLSVVLLAALVLMAPLVAQQPNAAEPFRQAIRANDLVALRALIAAHGTDVKDAAGLTPLILATAFGTRDAVDQLLHAGADVKTASNVGLTALHVAWHNAALVRLLIERGADVNAKTGQ